ncbi:hypothetical protein [Embleya scabrispora]|uniref:hypothetical protein n=1 Tax=Embleya scabrispora TaxID=159449 RepID=UPI001374B385|nr:hypothetical protein [Embleya scabrispora]
MTAKTLRKRLGRACKVTALTVAGITAMLALAAGPAAADADGGFGGGSSGGGGATGSW